MKIARITNFLNFGGIEKHFEIIANYQKTEDYIFISLGYGGEIENKIQKLGYEVICLNESVKIPNFKLIRKLIILFKTIKVDIVHSSAAESNFHSVIAAYISKIPIIICEEIGIPKHSYLTKIIFRIIYKFSNIVIGVSKSVSNYLIEIREVQENKSFTIYNPASIKSSTKELVNKTKGVFYIVTICRLVPIKNLKLLFKEIEFLNSNNVRSQLLLVGDGPQQNELVNYSNQLNISSYVSFIGFQENPYRFLKAADLFVLPSFSEGFAIAMVEAMMVGTPVIATKHGGPSEIIRNGENGWLFDPYTKNELRENIFNFLKLDIMERKKIANKAQDEAFKKYSPNIYINKIHKLYYSLSIGNK